MRLIDADKLKEDFADMREGYPIFSDTEMLSTKDIAKVIDNAPTVDKGYDFGYADGHGEGYELGKNSRPQGEWKVNNYGDVYCSNCGIMALCKEFMADDFREVKTDYCAFCGAYMRGNDNE